MKYTYEFKKRCVELYRQGEWEKTPKGVKEETFKKEIRFWARIEENQGVEALKHKESNKEWKAEEKLEIVSKVIAGKSIKSTAVECGINPGMLYQWVQKYKEKGYNGLISKRGRPSKEPEMKKKIDPTPLTESEREELIRLRAENEYIKAENEVIKKEIALREERQAALLKAKKQRLSKSSKKKDTN